MQLCASPLSSPLLELVALLAALVRSPPFASLAAATHAEAGRALCDAIAAARAVRRGRGDAAAGGGDGGGIELLGDYAILAPVSLTPLVHVVNRVAVPPTP